MAIAGEAAGADTGSESSAPEITADDLDLLSALDDVDEGGGDTGADEKAAAEAEVAKAAEAEAAKVAEAEAAKAASKEKGKSAKEEPKWFEGDIEDETLQGFAGNFESREALLEAVTGLQKALGIEPASDWREPIEDEQLREHADRFTSPADAVKKHFELRQKLSSALIPPGKKASKEEKAAFAGRLAKALGVPEKPEGYEFPAPPKGEKLTDAQVASRENWSGFFHQIHLPKAQATAILNKFAEETQAGNAAIAEADQKFADTSEAQLKSEWGNDFDVNRTLAARAGRELFGDEYEGVMEAQLANGRLLMDSTFMLRALARIGREMSEGVMDVMTTDEKETIDEQVQDLRSRADDAKEAGNARLANKLYQDEQALLSKLTGKQPIVGAGGRTV